MYLRRRVEGLNEAFCPVCERWLLLAHFEPIAGTNVLSEVCSACCQNPKRRITIT